MRPATDSKTMDQLKKRNDGALTWIGFSSVNNTIGSALLRELEYALEECAELPDSRALIICGSGKKFFSPGLNLHEVSRLDRAGMSEFMGTFSRLYLKLFTYPKPVLAMLNGDALAGGFLVASCCNFRYGHPGIRVGLTRLSRSVVMPFGSLKILEYLIGTEATQEITGRGKYFSAQRAFQIGWLDGIFSEVDLEKSVHLRALELARDPAEYLQGHRHDERRRLGDQIRCSERRHSEVFLNHWFSPEAQLQIEEMLRALNSRIDEAGSELDEEGKGVEKT